MEKFRQSIREVIAVRLVWLLDAQLYRVVVAELMVFTMRATLSTDSKSNMCLNTCCWFTQGTDALEKLRRACMKGCGSTSKYK